MSTEHHHGQLWHPRDLGDAAEAAAYHDLDLTIEKLPHDEDVLEGPVDADARVTAPLRSSTEVPFAGTARLHRGTPLEIKSVAVVVGEQERNGRFLLRRRQHDALLTADGAYLLLVCEPSRERAIIAAKIVTAELVDDVVGTWTEIKDRCEVGTAKIAWSRLFRQDEVYQ